MAGQQTAAPAAKRPILLRSAEEFCDAFFHVKETPEAGIAAVGCLRSGEKCRGKTTCLIARLMAVEGKGEDFLRIYYNHARNSCAEGFLIQDLTFQNLHYGPSRSIVPQPQTRSRTGTSLLTLIATGKDRLSYICS
mmetsp:Transcript_37445/g.58512  ORF Transcript_37445/g.58512 Transcript_37445/m.58512 type:complete len:136 (+) Transcript_37445:349-756(+)